METVAAWFKKYPSIEVISRDRSPEFAAAASQGAPQAVQVADRWHLGKNLAEALVAVLARCRAEQMRASRAKRQQVAPLSRPFQERGVYRSRREEQARLARAAEREQRYEQVLTLHRQGLRTSDIAMQVGMGYRTVREWLAHGSYPEPKQRRHRPSLVDRYEREVLKRREQGDHNGASLYRHLRALGYRGSQKALYRYLARLRFASSQAAHNESAPHRCWTIGAVLNGTYHGVVSAEVRRSQSRGASSIPTDQASQSRD